MLWGIGFGLNWFHRESPLRGKIELGEYGETLEESKISETPVVSHRRKNGSSDRAQTIVAVEGHGFGGCGFAESERAKERLRVVRIDLASRNKAERGVEFGRFRGIEHEPNKIIAPGLKFERRKELEHEIGRRRCFRRVREDTVVPILKPDFHGSLEREDVPGAGMKIGSAGAGPDQIHRPTSRSGKAKAIVEASTDFEGVLIQVKGLHDGVAG